MSDTPPDQKEAGDAPEGSGKHYVTYLVLAVLVAVLYVASIGPVCWLVEKHYLPEEVTAIYAPHVYLSEEHQRLLGKHVDWWFR